MCDSWILTEMPCMAHTPGPWYVNGDCIEADGPNGPRDITVAVATQTRRGFDNDDDARLIAAAPELLAALRVADDALDYAQAQCDSVRDQKRLRHWRTQVQNAIATAEGRTE
jgi:hypothetical protein